MSNWHRIVTVQETPCIIILKAQLNCFMLDDISANISKSIPETDGEIVRLNSVESEMTMLLEATPSSYCVCGPNIYKH